MVKKKSTEGTVEKKESSPLDVGKYGRLLLLGLLTVALIVIFSGGSTDTANTEEALNPDPVKSEAGTGVNDSEKTEDKTKTAEKDIVLVEMGSGTYRVDISPATCDSNLKTTSIDMEKFDLRSIDSEGVWFIEKPLIESEEPHIDKGIIFATVVIKRKNLEKFFMEFDGVEFQNLHADDDGNIYVDVKTTKNVHVEIYTTRKPTTEITHSETKTTSASVNNFLLAENVFERDDWSFVMLRITLSRYVY